MQLEFGECFEDINDALKAAVNALGGPKKVGPAMKPELPIEQAAQYVRDRLNSGRRERFTPEQMVYVLRQARAIGFHAAMDFVAADTGYKVTPVELEKQVESLEQRIADSLQMLNGHMATLARLKERVGQ